MLNNSHNIGYRVTGAGLSLLLLAIFLGGCTSEQYRKSADKEVYKAIKDKTPKVPNMDTNFTIETNALVPLTNLPIVTNAEAALGEDGKTEVGARIISLTKALEIGVKNSRTYQSRKEDVFLQALSLTMARHRFTPIFTAGGSVGYSGERDKVIVNGIEIISDKHGISGGPDLGMDVLLSSGARIATDLTTDFENFLLGGDPRTIAGSKLAATLTQPLLRGAGYKVVMENLTQADRDLLYAIRDFTQYRKDFSLQVATSYYDVLRLRDIAKNEFRRAFSFKENAKRTRAMVRESLAKQAELGRLEQEEITTDITLNNSIRAYKQSLDQFKMLIGMPTDANLVLDDQDLRNLKIEHPSLGVIDAVKVALNTRLDLYTTKDQYEDSARKVYVAKNGLLPDLNLVINTSATTQPGTGLPKFDYQQIQWGAGMNVSLPIDRKAERNTYRASLIANQRAWRALEQKVDTIKLNVYESWRRLDQAKRNYESSVMGVKLSERRVREQTLLAQLGRATAKDQVDAQNDLTRSQNDLTAALVNHTISRLTLWRDIGLLKIGDTGQWEKLTDDTQKQ